MIKQGILFITLVVFFLSTACSRKSRPQSSANNKTCLQQKIDAFSRSACSSGASVKEYVFQGKKVYAFDQGTCGADFTTEVMDEACNSLGYLGGITGNVLINNEDFSKAEFTKSLWESASR